MPAAIVVKDIRRSYGETRAVDGVSLRVEEGEFFGILGPNGAGKTTTLEIIEGLRKPDSGEVSLLGLPPWPRNKALLRRIGVQMQSSSLFDRLTAQEQIRSFAALFGVSLGAADDLMETFGLAEKAGTLTNDLSGGQAQRLAIACAMVHSPEVVFLDEPTAGLDPQSRHNLWDLLRNINAQGRTVVLTTHYIEEAEALCHRVAIMDCGKILRTGAPLSLIRTMNAATHITLAPGALALGKARQLFPDSVVSGDEGSLTIATHDPAAVVTGLAQENALQGLVVRTATLEDVYLTLTGREYRP